MINVLCVFTHTTLIKVEYIIICYYLDKWGLGKYKIFTMFGIVYVVRQETEFGLLMNSNSIFT